MERLPTEILQEIFTQLGQIDLPSLVALSATSRAIRARYLENERYIPHRIAFRAVNGLIPEIRTLALLLHMAQTADYMVFKESREKCRQTLLPHTDPAVSIKELWDAAIAAVQIRTIIEWILRSGLPGWRNHAEKRHEIYDWMENVPKRILEFQQRPIDLDERANDFKFSSLTSLLRITILSRTVIEFERWRSQSHPFPTPNQWPQYKNLGVAPVKNFLADQFGLIQAEAVWTTHFGQHVHGHRGLRWNKGVRFNMVYWMVEYCVRTHFLNSEKVVREKRYHLDSYKNQYSPKAWKVISLEDLVNISEVKPYRAIQVCDTCGSVGGGNLKSNS